MSHMATSVSPTSASSLIAQLINDEAVAVPICTPVYADAPGGFKKALGDGSAKAKVVGLVIDQSIPSTKSGAVLSIGVVTASTAQWDVVAGTSGGLTFGTIYYLHSTVAGTLTTASTSGVPVVFGLATTLGAIILGSNASGISNSAGPNVLMKSNGSNAVASGITDDGSIVATARKFQIGPTVVPTQNNVFWSSTDIAKSTFAWVTVDSVGHVGFGGNNESIPLVLRNNSTHAMGAGGSATAGGVDIAVQTGKASGTGALTARAIVTSAQGGDVGENYALYATHGVLRADDGASFGPTQVGALTCTGTISVAPTTSLVALGRNLDGFEVTAAGAQGAIVGIGNFNTGAPLSVKNTTSGTSGLNVHADTSLNGNVSGFVVFYRGSGNGSEKGGIGIVGNAGSFATGSVVGDTLVYNYDAGSAGQRVAFASGPGPKVGATLDDVGTFRVTSANGQTGKCTVDTSLTIAGITISAGTGSPAGVVVGSPGDLYTNKAGGASTTLYVKESGAATNTGWVAK